MHRWHVEGGEILCITFQYKPEPSGVKVEMAIES
jgi:hypothetical protein